MATGFSRNIYVVRQPKELATVLLNFMGPLALLVFGFVQLARSLIGVVVFVVTAIVCAAIIERWVASTSTARKRLAARHYIGKDLTAGSQLGGSVAARDMGDYCQTDVLSQNATWSMYDLLYNAKIETEQGVLKCYTVFEASLVRTAPHLVFDAKQAHGRQFSSLFVHQQQISLEGSFDQYFDVYAPDHYVIDTMSFISPEVMDSFMTLKYCDAEILHDRLLVYAPLLAAKELAQFQADSIELAKQLNDNLSRYHDSYLPSKAARKHISPFARLLLENPWKGQWPSLLFGVAATVTALLIGAFATELGYYSVYSIIGYSILAGSVTRIVLRYRLNERKKHSFYSDLRVMQTRGRY